MVSVGADSGTCIHPIISTESFLFTGYISKYLDDSETLIDGNDSEIVIPKSVRILESIDAVKPSTPLPRFVIVQIAVMLSSSFS